jgi:hypothetical protein
MSLQMGVAQQAQQVQQLPLHRKRNNGRWSAGTNGFDDARQLKSSVGLHRA